MLQVKNLNKSFGTNLVLDGIDFEVLDNEFLVLVGPSGSGKSTLMRILAGLENDFSGQLLYKGNNLSSKAPKDRNISMVFQNYALYPHKTVFENIAFPLQLQNLKKLLIKEKVLAVAEKLELTEFLKRKPAELSGGQRQRVALARALIKEPDIFLMDEPLSNLDAKLRVQLRQEIFKLKSLTNALLIYVTHDQIEALTLGDKIAVLNEGKIQQLASPSELYEKPANTFVASFIGSPPMNLISRHQDQEIIGFRPDAVSFTKIQDDDLALNGVLLNIENLGSEFIFYLDIKEYDSENLICLKLKNSSELTELVSEFQEKKIDSQKLINLEFFVAKNLLYYFNKQSKELI